MLKLEEGKMNETYRLDEEYVREFRLSGEYDGLLKGVDVFVLPQSVKNTIKKAHAHPRHDSWLSGQMRLNIELAQMIEGLELQLYLSRPLNLEET